MIQTKSEHSELPSSSNGRVAPRRQRQEWNLAQEAVDVAEKAALGEFVARHEFLVPAGGNAEDGNSVPVSAVVTAGTTPTEIVKKCLNRISERCEKDEGPFFVTWYTPSSLASHALRVFTLDHPEQRTASEVFLFPGLVDFHLGCVVGPEAEEFAKNQLKRRFSYGFYGVHQLDLSDGLVLFQFEREMRLQKALAELPVSRKYLFVTPRRLPDKFRLPEGVPGYTIKEMLQNCRLLTICITAFKGKEVDRELIESVKYGLEQLETVLRKDVPNDGRLLRVCFIQANGEALPEDLSIQF